MMTAVDIIKMAIKELSSPFDEDLVCFTHQELTNFVNLIAAAEREACAGVADDAKEYNRHISKEIAKAVRARSQP
jgi:hypothetical protein